MPEVGDTLGRYTLLRRLAIGGMGEVFVAAKPGPVGFGPYVALKVLRDELACDQQFVDMLVDEANISMFLNHQNVVSVLDLGTDDETYYIAMEFVQGITVERLVDSMAARGKKLAVPVGLYIGAELCRALKYAHTRVNHSGEPLNIVHRDVTPANVLLSTQGEVKLTDFGIARAKGRVHQTQAGVLKGKFGYMAPEMVRYEKIDARADLFCTGVCLYLMLSGQHPVAGAAVMEAIQKFEDKRIPPPSSINPEISPELDEVVMRCLEPNVDNRWTSAAELGAALQDVMLRNSTWRHASNDGARLIAGQIREVAPEVFDAPVSAEQTRHLLERARADLASNGQAPMTPVGQDRLQSLRGRIPTDPPMGPFDPATEDQFALQPQDLVELPTATSLPAISPDMDFGATPAANSPLELETDEQLSLHKVQVARQQLVDTEEQDPAVTDDGLDAQEGSDGAVPSAPADATLATPAVGGSAHEVAFLDSSTDRNRLHAEMMDEPSLPLGGEGFSAPVGVDLQDRTVAQVPAFGSEFEEGVIDRPLRPNDDDDGATVVGYEGGPDMFGSDVLGASTLDPQVDSDAFEVPPALSTGDLVPVGATAKGGAVRLSGYHPQALDDDDAATIIPEMLGPLDAARIAAQAPDDGSDATLLDGLDAQDVKAALEAAKAEAAAAPRLDSAAMDALVADAVAPTGVSPAVGGPRPLDGPLRVPTDIAPPPPDRPPGTIGPDESAAPPWMLKEPAPLEPEIDPTRIRDPAVEPDVGVGDSTGRWMAGELGADALSWDDDAAARRAVATRNQPAGYNAPSAPPTPGYNAPGAPPTPGYNAPSAPPTPGAPMPVVPGVPMHAAGSYAPGMNYPPQPIGLPQGAPEPSFLARNGLLIAAVGLVLVVFSGLGYGWFYTEWFWPNLTLESDPPGATVILDDVELVGVTPMTVPVAPDRAHRVEVRREGYQTVSRQITDKVTYFGNYRLENPLTKAVRQVFLPAEGTVFVNGEVVATGKQVELADIPREGPITLKVEAKGYAPYTFTFEDPASIPTSLDVPLQKL